MNDNEIEAMQSVKAEVNRRMAYMSGDELLMLLWVANKIQATHRVIDVTVLYETTDNYKIEMRKTNHET